MLPRPYLLLLMIVWSAAACQAALPPDSTPTLEPSITTPATPEVTPTAEASAAWEQVVVKGVQIAIEIPPGWDAQKTRDGLMLAEDFGTMESGTTPQGMQIHLFVHSLDGYKLPVSQDTNVAWAVLEQIIAQPDTIGTAQVSAPSGFKWDGHDAAYYLLNPNDGSVSLLVAVALSAQKRLVVCNFSSPAQDAAEIRAMLPEILSSLTINGVSMDIAGLRDLPDPLHFPQTEATETPD